MTCKIPLCRTVAGLFLAGFVFAACVPDSPPTLTAQAKAASPTAAAGLPTVTPTPTTAPSALVDPADVPSPYTGPLPEGAVARLGQGIIRLVTTSPDGAIGAVGTSSGVLAYDAASRKLLWAAPTSYAVTRIDWSPKSDRLTAQGDGFNVITFDALTGREMLPINYVDPPNQARPVLAITGADQNQVGFVDASGGVSGAILTGTAEIDDLAWSPDGTRLAVGTTISSAPNHVVVWDVASARPPLPLGSAALALDPAGIGYAISAGWSSTGKLLALAYGDHVHLFDTTTWAEVDPPGIDSISTFAWAPDGDRIAVGGRSVWSVSQKRALYPITGADLPPAWSGDGKVLITSGGTGELVAWDGETGQKLRTLADSGPYVVSMALDGDGSTLAASAFGYRSDPCGKVNMWSVPTGKVRWSITTRNLPPFGCPRELAFSPDYKNLAIAFTDKGVGGIAVFDAQSGRRLKVLRGHASYVSALAFSPDGSLLASSSGDGTVILWDMAR